MATAVWQTHKKKLGERLVVPCDLLEWGIIMAVVVHDAIPASDLEFWRVKRPSQLIIALPGIAFVVISGCAKSLLID